MVLPTLGKSVLKVGLYFEKMGFYSQCHINTDIHSKYILRQIKVPKNKLLFIKEANFEATGSPELSSRRLIFSSDKTHKKLYCVKIWLNSAIL